MNLLFSWLGLADVHRDGVRNIVSIRASQAIVDDHSDCTEHRLLAQQVEDAVKSLRTARGRRELIGCSRTRRSSMASCGQFGNWQASRISAVVSNDRSVMHPTHLPAVPK